MSFIFKPLSEEEINSLSLVEPGIYNFEVIKAEHKTSKAGNPMIELQLKFWDTVGKEHIIFDYLVSMPSMMYKIRNFCKSINIMPRYEQGTIDVNDCLNKQGKAEIFIKIGEAKFDGTRYSDKNAVRDYCTADTVTSAPSAPATQKQIDMEEDIPF